MAAEKASLDSQAEQIMQVAKNYGVEKNYLFLTTFSSLQDTLGLLAKLKESIEADGPTVTKTYVKGRENVCINPAITEYNKTTKTFNDTVATLMRIIDGFKKDEEEPGDDPLLAVLQGR